MRYVDGFVLVVKTKRLKEYVKMAQLGAKVWKKHGALQYVEAIGEDMKAEWGLPFPKLTKKKPDETVVFSWIMYKSRKHRDQVVKKVMADPELNMDGKKDMPFDLKRMSYGGFEIIVENET